MIVTKEQQIAWLEEYKKTNKTTDECFAFLEGMQKALEYVQKQLNK